MKISIYALCQLNFRSNKSVSFSFLKYCSALVMFCLVTSISWAQHNYAEVLQKNLFFYDAQKSGPLPVGNQVIWRSHSGLNDGSDVGVDLTGGLYDAGDHVKFGLPLASTTSMLAWSVFEYEGALQSAGLLDKTLELIKWNTDYFIKCHPSANTFFYQVGNGNSDHGWWGSAEVLEEVMERPAYVVDMSSPGSSVAAGTAISLALASIIFEDRDPAYASACLQHAEELFDFAYSTQSDAGYGAARGFYDSYSGFWDEISAAGAWLYLKTGNNIYLQKAEEGSTHWTREGRKGSDPWGYKWTHSWDDNHYMAQIVLARITQAPEYIESIERNLDFWLPGGGISYSPGGQAWLDQWGSLRYSANASFLACVWADETLGDQAKKSSYFDFAREQINYILGDNPRNSSYVIGYGNNPPINPHHRTAHGAWYNDINAPADNQHILFGALVGGPSSANDQYEDDRTDYVMNEVACDYNAGLFAAVTRLYQEFGGSVITDFPENYFIPEEERRPEYFVRAIVNSESGTSYQLITQTSNRSAWPATVKENMSFRYFFDISEAVELGYTIENINVSVGNNEGGALNGPYLWEGNIYYLEIDFTGEVIYPGGRTECEREFGFTLSGPSDAAWNSSNDWSFQGLTSGSFTFEPVDYTGMTDYIPVYDQGVLLSGQEPGPAAPGPPSVSITSPEDGNTFNEGDVITIEALASDPDGSVAQVEFFLNSSTVGIDNTAPYSISVSNLPEGSYEVYAVATADDNESSTSSIVTFSVVAPGVCSSPQWDPDATYNEGDIVQHEGINWEYKSKRPGNSEPGTKGKWNNLGPCNGSSNARSNQISDLYINANPFSDKTSIAFRLAEPDDVIFEVFNINGALISSTSLTKLASGNHHIEWSAADDVQSGILIYVISTSKEIRRGKMLFIR